VIEERQRKTLEHVRLSTGYAEGLNPHAHDQATFRLINQRKEPDSLPGAATVLPALDDWKYWTKMNDWDSRNRLLEHLTDKMLAARPHRPRSSCSSCSAARRSGRWC
jgi:hypothetical protein